MKKNRTNYKQENFLSNQKIFFIFFILGLAINFFSFNAPFIWDDEVIILSNQLIKNFKNIFLIFNYDLFGEKITSSTQFYRPITNLSFFIDYFFSGNNPFFYHFLNTILHIFNSFFVYLIFLKMLQNEKLSFYSALLFLISPVNTFSISYISNRTVILGSFFAYLSLLSFMEIKFISSFLYFLLAMFAKEDFVTLPFIFLLYFIFYKRHDSFIVKKLSFFILTSLLYGIFRLILQHKADIIPLSFLREESLTVRILTFLKSFLFYIYKIIIPLNIPFEKHFLVSNIFNVYLFIFFSIIAILIFFKKEKLYWFFFLSTLISLAPVSSIILPISASLRIHFIYFSSFIITSTLVKIIDKIKEKTEKQLPKVIYTVCAIAYFIFLIIESFIHVKIWNNKEKFYLKQIELEPNSFLALNNLGREYFANGNYDKAFEYFYLSAIRSPHKSYNVAWNNIGVIYQRRGNLQKAVECYQKSIDYGDYYLGYKNLIELYYYTGKKEELINTLKKALKKYPNDSYFHSIFNLIR